MAQPLPFTPAEIAGHRRALAQIETAIARLALDEKHTCFVQIGFPRVEEMGAERPLLNLPIGAPALLAALRLARLERLDLIARGVAELSRGQPQPAATLAPGA